MAGGGGSVAFGSTTMEGRGGSTFTLEAATFFAFSSAISEIGVEARKYVVNSGVS